MCTWVQGHVVKIGSAVFATCTEKGIENWATKQFGCASSQHCLRYYPRKCGSRDAILARGHAGVLCCVQLCLRNASPFALNSALRGNPCSAVWSCYLQEKSFYSESKSNFSVSGYRGNWVQSITSLLPHFHTNHDSLCTQILSVSQLWSNESKTGIDFSECCKG